MNKKIDRKLTLNPHTVRVLTTTELGAVVGGTDGGTVKRPATIGCTEK